MKQPKEIWVHNMSIEMFKKFDAVNVTISTIEGYYGDLKYISEQHHFEQIEVLKKEIDELRYQLENRNREGIPEQ